MQTVNAIVSSAQKVDYDHIVSSISDSVNVVMIGEASHGTECFYRHRAEITKRLIEEKGFTIIGLEADWPDTARLNQYVHGAGKDSNATQSLKDYTRFPTWMWSNDVVANFAEWLRKHNAKLSTDKTVGIHGLDVYSLDNSTEKVLEFVRTRYPSLLPLAEDAYLNSIFSKVDVKDSRKVVHELEKLYQQNPESDELFDVLQNARCVVGAAEYSQKYDPVSSWNHRDTFMFNTLTRLVERRSLLEGRPAKAIIWAHNSHLGDSTYTYMHEVRKLNIGRLCREKWGKQVMNIGFTTHTGTVTAANNWNELPQYKRVNPSMKGSVEQVLHQASEKMNTNEFMLVFRSTASQDHVASREVLTALSESYLERAIGVIYRPQTERQSHYFEAEIAQQFDIIIHVDTTRALTPIGIMPSGFQEPQCCE